MTLIEVLLVNAHELLSVETDAPDYDSLNESLRYDPYIRGRFTADAGQYAHRRITIAQNKVKWFCEGGE